MPFYLQERFFENPPYLLAPGGEQHLISPGPAGELLLQRGTGSFWDEPRPLPQRGESYCAALDRDQLLHLIIMDQGNFYHLIPSPEREKEAVSLFYHEESKVCSHFLITGAGESTLHFLCLAVESALERWWLLHHRYSGGAWEEPRVIDFGSGALENYGDLAVDNRDCLHLVYRIAGAGQSGLYYRNFDREKSHWSKAFPLSLATPSEYPAIAIDETQNIHVLWRTFSESKYFICYRFMGGPGWKTGGWKQETVISSAMAGPPFPFFSHHSGELLICWVEGGTLQRYRFSGDKWDQIAPQSLEKPLLIRAKSFNAEGVPLNYWIPLEGGGTAAGTPLSDLLPKEEDNLDSDFSKLHRYSGKLIGRLSDLSTEKARLEKEAKSRGREMFLLSQQSEKNMRQLRRDLDDKDSELKKLQLHFDQIIGTMKKKIEQGSRAREAERRRYLDELQELQKERRQIERIMQEKEKTIARLEAHIREQHYAIEKLREKNEMLTARAAESWSLKRLWERMGLHKKPGG